jgi:tetratricopeptide (TPR) repeat protein
MATVSGNPRFTLIVAALVPILFSGCNTVMPVKPQAEARAISDIATSESHSPLAIVPTDTPLPRQTYNAAGEKIAYVPQPNPYTTEVATVPSEANAIFLTANARLKAGDMDGARKKFITLTEKYPALSGPWIKLGAIAETEEKYPEAMEHYQRAISVNRNNVNAYIALGLLQRKQGKFSNAFETYHEALNIWKDFPEAHLNLAILYDLYLNNAEEAQKHYEAYDFLTGEKDARVKKWLVEVRHRTGIEISFIDNPPANAAGKAPDGQGGSVAVAISNEEK